MLGKPAKGCRPGDPVISEPPDVRRCCFQPDIGHDCQREILQRQVADLPYRVS